MLFHYSPLLQIASRPFVDNFLVPLLLNKTTHPPFWTSADCAAAKARRPRATSFLDEPTNDSPAVFELEGRATLNRSRLCRSEAYGRR